MRKTVHEWLETHQNGTAAAKKKAASRRSRRHRVLVNAVGGKMPEKARGHKNRISKAAEVIFMAHRGATTLRAT
jgi:hypothetical protein